MMNINHSFLFCFILSFAVFFPIQSFVPSKIGIFRNVEAGILLQRNVKRLSQDEEVTSSRDSNKQDFSWLKKSVDKVSGESVYDSIIDYDVTNKAIVFEVSLGRSLGIEISQGDKKAVISEVISGSRADQLGIRVGDAITALQATAGDQLWEHVAEESVKAALNTRFVMNSTVRLRLQRQVEDIDQELMQTLMVPYVYNVRIRRPIGLHVLEGPNKKVYIEEIKPDGGAAKTKTIEVGDEVVAMSASWGDRMWDVNSVESFVVGIRMRSDPSLSFKLKRLVTLASYIKTASNRFVRKDYALSHHSRIMGEEGHAQSTQPIERPAPPMSFNEMIEKCTNGSDVEAVWHMLQANKFYSTTIENYSLNRIMSTALSLERADIAVRVFEQAYGFKYVPNNPAKDALLATDDLIMPRGAWSESPLASKPLSKGSAVPLIEPNNFVCSTVIKAYGRLGAAKTAMTIIPWLEDKGREKADIYTLSSLLYVCAKEKKVAEAEKIFWEDIPARGLNYTVATTNSLMYMYAKLNRADDALRVYEVTKSLQIKCTVVTFGVLIKALMTSGKKQLESTSYEILASLPSMGITPGIDIYNQFLEHYAKTHDFHNSKKILELMARAKPRVRPDAISYGFIITCYSDAKKPKSTLAIYHQMKKQGLTANGYIYMGVLKALATMRDGLSAVQVITEMRENGIQPDKRHVSMAMFACVISGVNNLAESLLALYVRTGGVPDAALFTLLLRALLQQNKWNEGYALLRKMSEGNQNSRPNFVTMNYLLRSQVIAYRYSEAVETLSIILKAVALGSQIPFFEPWQDVNFNDGVQPIERPNALPKINPSSILCKNLSPQGVLKDATECLSFSLGIYSEHMNKIQKLDAQHQVKSYGGSPANIENAKNVETIDLTEFGFSPDQALGKPSLEALEFLVECAVMIASQEGTLLPGEFYMELLQALVSEGTPELTSRVLDIGQSKGIRVKRSDMVKMSKVEDLAKRSIQGKRNVSFSVTLQNAPDRRSKIGW